MPRPVVQAERDNVRTSVAMQPLAQIYTAGKIISTPRYGRTVPGSLGAEWRPRSYQPRNRRSPQAAVREVAGPAVFEATTRRTAARQDRSGG